MTNSTPKPFLLWEKWQLTLQFWMIEEMREEALRLMKARRKR